MKIVNILEELNSTKSAKVKESILRKYKDNKILKDLLYWTYNPDITFGVSNLKDAPLNLGNIYNTESVEDRWLDISILLNDLSKRSITGNVARDKIFDIIFYLDNENVKIFTSIFKKKLECRLGISTINKVFGSDFLPEEFCQLAKGITDKKRSKLVYPVYTDSKLDGFRAIVKVKDGNATIYSRTGKIKTQYKDIEKSMSYFPDGEYDGEITSKNFQYLMKSVNRKTNVDEWAEGSVYNIFDIINDSELRDRIVQRNKIFIETQIKIDNINKFLNVKINNIKNVSGLFIHNELDLMKEYEKLLKEGYEGIMIKDLDASYKKKRSWNWIKMKPELSDDLEVLDIIEGKGEMVGTLGAIVCRLENGKTVNVGTGFKLPERDDFWARKNEIIGTIAEIKYQEKTDDGSLRFPVWKRWRPDK